MAGASARFGPSHVQLVTCDPVLAASAAVVALDFDCLEMSDGHPRYATGIIN